MSGSGENLVFEMNLNGRLVSKLEDIFCTLGIFDLCTIFNISVEDFRHFFSVRYGQDIKKYPEKFIRYLVYYNLDPISVIKDTPARFIEPEVSTDMIDNFADEPRKDVNKINKIDITPWLDTAEEETPEELPPVPEKPDVYASLTVEATPVQEEEDTPEDTSEDTPPEETLQEDTHEDTPMDSSMALDIQPTVETTPPQALFGTTVFDMTPSPAPLSSKRKGRPSKPKVVLPTIPKQDILIPKQLPKKETPVKVAESPVKEPLVEVIHETPPPQLIKEVNTTLPEEKVFTPKQEKEEVKKEETPVASAPTTTIDLEALQEFIKKNNEELTQKFTQELVKLKNHLQLSDLSNKPDVDAKDVLTRQALHSVPTKDLMDELARRLPYGASVMVPMKPM